MPDSCNVASQFLQRHVGLRVEAQDAEGKKFSRSFSGWTARVFQHEYDHLQVRSTRTD